MLLAAVDVGSNSFRLEIGRADGSHIERRGYWKEIVRLAAGLDADNRLSKKAIETARECLARINERLRGMPASHVRAVGTQTLRQALNADEFLLEGQHALGFPIEIISGREEARLVFEGCMHSLAPSQKRRLVVDIGGASSEVIVGRTFEADKAESFKIGCLNVTLKFFPDGTIDRAAFRRAQVACEADLEEAQAFFGRGRWDEAYGTSGTIGAVSLVLRDQGWTDGTVTPSGLARLRQALLAAGDVRRVRFDGLKQERAAVLAAPPRAVCGWVCCTTCWGGARATTSAMPRSTAGSCASESTARRPNGSPRRRSGFSVRWRRPPAKNPSRACCEPPNCTKSVRPCRTGTTTSTRPT
jgi:exopolyphosphatase / guanosine-5'-triphosphate,3'-diphosphate pyrophosphatase